jgi:hypothetical protein
MAPICQDFGPPFLRLYPLVDFDLPPAFQTLLEMKMQGLGVVEHHGISLVFGKDRLLFNPFLFPPILLIDYLWHQGIDRLSSRHRGIVEGLADDPMI